LISKAYYSQEVLPALQTHKLDIYSYSKEIGCSCKYQ
jgi:hypothetical protein